MALQVFLQNPRSGETKRLKVGWSWTLFFFAFTGLPLFLRRLYVWGGVFLAFWVLTLAEPGLWFLFLGMHIWIAIKGNEMAGKNYLDQGWVFATGQELERRYAISQWRLSESWSHDAR